MAGPARRRASGAGIPGAFELLWTNPNVAGRPVNSPLIETMRSRHTKTALLGLCVLALPGFAVQAELPDPPNTEPSATRALSPGEAAAGFRVPEGFRVDVFAAAPDVRNPVALAWDTRGRLWVAENYSY